MNYSKEDLSQLKKEIKKKFKTLKHFGYSSGMDYYMLNKFFGRKLGAMNMDAVKSDVQKLLAEVECKPFDGLIEDQEREYLRKKILVNYRSINQFITDNPQFSKSFISNIINGKRKKRDDRYSTFKYAVMQLNVQPEEIMNS